MKYNNLNSSFQKIVFLTYVNEYQDASKRLSSITFADETIFFVKILTVFFIL